MGREDEDDGSNGRRGWRKVERAVEEMEAVVPSNRKKELTKRGI